MMIRFTTIIKKFNRQGEKTGWTYIEIPAAIAEKLKPGNKKSFRVKGSLDEYLFEGIALLPMGNGGFILALNAAIRNQLKKNKGAALKVVMEEDKSTVKLNAELLECLADEPGCLAFFNSLTPGHRKYFSNWINSAKTDPTKAKRIAQTLNALSHGFNYGEMIRTLSDKNNLK